MTSTNTNPNFIQVGPQGPIGPSGAQGPQGLTGSIGLKGDQGAAGPRGLAASISVGNVITSGAGTQAIITNSGDQSDAIFNFTIPKGDQGDKGDTGTVEANYSSSSGGATFTLDAETGDLFVLGTVTTNGVTSINNSTTSTSTTSGALTVDGGVGIGQNVYIGGT